MFPALPTGMARMSGARPRSSQTSKAAVFWPSRRNGLTELTSVTGWSSCSASARTMCSAWSKLPSMATTRAPQMSAWSSFPSAMWPFGRITMTSSPACAPYAAADAEVLPVDAHTTALAPASTAFATATTMPRSLNEPGRVLALDLEVQVRGADRLPEPLRAHERGRALAQRQGRGRVRHRQESAVPLHQPRPGVRRRHQRSQSSTG